MGPWCWSEWTYPSTARFKIFTYPPLSRTSHISRAWSDNCMKKKKTADDRFKAVDSCVTVKRGQPQVGHTSHGPTGFTERSCYVVTCCTGIGRSHKCGNYARKVHWILLTGNIVHVLRYYVACPSVKCFRLSLWTLCKQCENKMILLLQNYTDLSVNQGYFLCFHMVWLGLVSLREWTKDILTYISPVVMTYAGCVNLYSVGL